MIIETNRLFLEPFSMSHLEGLNKLDSDPIVMRFLGPKKSVEETKEAIKRLAERWERQGYSWWAQIEKKSGALIGSACVQNIANDLDAPLEIGWRLLPHAQGKGFATEAGAAAMAFAFQTLDAAEVLAIAAPENVSSNKTLVTNQDHQVGSTGCQTPTRRKILHFGGELSGRLFRNIDRPIQIALGLTLNVKEGASD